MLAGRAFSLVTAANAGGRCSRSSLLSGFCFRGCGSACELCGWRIDLAAETPRGLNTMAPVESSSLVRSGERFCCSSCEDGRGDEGDDEAGGGGGAAAAASRPCEARPAAIAFTTVAAGRGLTGPLLPTLEEEVRLFVVTLLVLRLVVLLLVVVLRLVVLRLVSAREGRGETDDAHCRCCCASRCADAEVARGRL